MKYSKPKSVEAIGEKVFIKENIYKRKKPLKALYINEELYEKLFNKKYVFEEAESILSEYFSLTLENTGALVGKCYVDYQNDPTGIALDGNVGSGRAFYIGETFNVKGDKTSMAVSSDPVYNNGKLSMPSAVAEALMSNVLSRDMKPKTFDTLAVFDTDEPYKFPYNEMDTAYLVRHVDEENMYRFSHRFVNKKPFTKEELISIAKELGTLEGNKYIERFLHGAWSLGNISTKSNMIDFDTSCFVKNRNPSFSFSYRYKTNYFGYEYLADIKILEIILSSELNIDNVNIDELKEILIKERKEEIKKGLCKLTNIEQCSEIDELTELFLELSNYYYKDDSAYYTGNIFSDEIAIFDFPKLFRYYPLYKYLGYKKIKAFSLLVNDKDIVNFPNREKEIPEYVYQYFGEYVFNDLNPDLIEKSTRFIELYDMLLSKNLKKETVINSYILNEDRTYLLGFEEIRYELIDIYKKNGGKYTSELMNIITKLSSRNYTLENKICDATIFEEAVIYKRIYDDNYRYELIPLMDNYDIPGCFKYEDGIYVSEYYELESLVKNEFKLTTDMNVLGRKKRNNYKYYNYLYI